MNETTNNKCVSVPSSRTISLWPELETGIAVASTPTSRGPVSHKSGSTRLPRFPSRFTRTSSQLIAPRPFSGTCRRTSVSSAPASSSFGSVPPAESPSVCYRAMRPPERSHLQAPVREAGGQGHLASGHPSYRQTCRLEAQSAGQPAVDRGRPHFLYSVRRTRV